MHFRIMLLGIKIIIISYLLSQIWSKMFSLSRDVMLKLSKTTSPQKNVLICLHHTVNKQKRTKYAWADTRLYRDRSCHPIDAGLSIYLRRLGGRRMRGSGSFGHIPAFQLFFTTFHCLFRQYRAWRLVSQSTEPWQWTLKSSQ